MSFSQTPAAGGGDGDPTLDELLPGPTAHDPVNQVISTEELHSLVACLSSVLSELESSVLSLYLDGHSYEAIAERLECDTKTVDNALQRVKRKVGAHLSRAKCCSRTNVQAWPRLESGRREHADANGRCRPGAALPAAPACRARRRASC